MKSTAKKGIFLAILAAALYAISSPLSKLLLNYYAQRTLGAARTSAYYAIAPFIGAFLSLLIFRTIPSYTYFIALGLMVIGAWLCASDEPVFKKRVKNKEG